MTANIPAEKLKVGNKNQGFDNVLGGTRALPPSWQECFSVTNGLSLSILHDLRNPLAAICGCAELLVGANLDPMQSARVATNIQRAAARMQDLLGALSFLTRDDSEAMEVCNVRSIAVSASQAAGVDDQAGIEVFLDVPSRLEIAVLRPRVESVLVNLIVNAMEAMPRGGEIRIAAVEAGDHVLIAVEDNGPGVPSEIRDRLFDPYVTAGKQRGVGLGLTFCRHTVRDHGGELWLDTAAAGARFVFSLPKRSPSPSQSAVLGSTIAGSTVAGGSRSRVA